MRKNFILIILASAFLCLNFAKFSQSTVLQEKAVKNPLRQPVLSLLETSLDSNITKEGQDFSAKLMEDVFYDGQALIPKFSMVYGTVLKVKKAGQLNKDAFIQLKIIEIKTPDEKIISIKDKPLFVEVSRLAYSQKNNGFIKELPVTIANSATSIVLGQFSSVADAAVWAISTGAGITAGFISGIISPDEGKTRAESSAQRALDSTPLGSVSTVVKKGENICLNPGQYICIFFDRQTVEHIKENISFTQNNKTLN